MPQNDPRRRNALARAVLESATDFAIVTTDLDGRVTSWNPGAEQLLGWTPEEMLGEHACRFFTPEDNEAGRCQLEMDLARVNGRAEDERWHLKQNGSRLWASGLMMRFEDPDTHEHIGYLKILRDRTAQYLADEAARQDEHHDRALADISDRLRTIDDPGAMQSEASAVIGAALGVSRVGYGTVEDNGERFSVPHDWTAPGFPSLAGTYELSDYGLYADDLRAGSTVVIDDIRTDPRTADNPEPLAALSVRSLINHPIVERGRTVAILYANTPDSRRWRADEIVFLREAGDRLRQAIERRRAEIELRSLNGSLEQRIADRTTELLQYEEQLRQAQKMEAVGQLTGGLAHDFNNLLTGITGSLEMMAIRIGQGRLGDVEKYNAAAQGAAKRAAALTHRLLAFSRRQTLDPKATETNRLVEGMIDLIRRTVGPEIDLRFVGGEGLWVTLVDPHQLENALLNLCINARDAMPGGGTLTIETANRALDERSAKRYDLDPGRYVALCVSDSGTGMTPDVIDKAFDPFFTTKPIGVGTGLGLSMIYGFARQSGGQVRIHSVPGEGTSVCVYLPQHIGAATDDMPLPDLGDAPRGQQGETVLVVDDEPAVRMLVTDVLEELGYIAIEAADGAGGLKVLQSDARIDLLVSDVGLPGGMNGRQMADAARVGRPDLKVLFITGYAENAVVGAGQMDAGMHVMSKPFAMEALATRIRTLIEG